MNYIITVFSDRIYYLDKQIQQMIDEAIHTFNQAKYCAYNYAFLRETDKNKHSEKYGNKSCYLVVKEKYGMNTYYTNSAVNEGVGVFDAQKENYEAKIKQTEAEIKKTKEELKEANKKLKNLKGTLDNFIAYRTALKEGKKKKFKAKGLTNISVDEDKVIVRNIKKKKIVATEYGLYAFEYQYLRKKIRETKNNISKKNIQIE